MHFLSGTSDEAAMLSELGLSSTEQLFSDVPPHIRAPLRIAPGRTELEVVREMRTMLGQNEPFEKRPHFLGAGAYHHYVPALVKPLILRGEFYTSYTPYQPEILQGMLQAMFEYQTYVCRLTSMEVANVSMYDGPTALAEAAVMGIRASRGHDILVPKNLFWEKKSIVRNYVKGHGARVVEFGYDRTTGEADLADLESKLSAETAAVLLQNPNFFGVFESRAPDVRAIIDRKAPKALYVVDVGDPFSLGLINGPGAYGADVAVGELAGIGSGTWFGGPALGLFATKWDHVRRMPGRIVGETVDHNGERGYCLTLSTREQHIRRDKATSNICSNEALNALAFAIHLAAIGEEGFRTAAETCAVRARNLATRLAKVPGVRTPLFRGNHFHEFVLQTDQPYAAIEEKIRRAGLRGGVDLKAWHPELGNAALFCVTETHPEAAIDRLVSAISGVHA
ncbi:MAG: aminomethyl-transferring glycine dehydrogenase subunit GcvPA [Thermoplasmatota archaeon]